MTENQLYTLLDFFDLPLIYQNSYPILNQFIILNKYSTNDFPQMISQHSMLY